MAASPSPSLYRSARRGVILAILLLLAAIAAAQFGRPTVSKGPRALGLLELAPNGRGHLIPIAIMVDGEFYDAGAYKASPVPMALDAQTVYEAEQTGKSVGLFTVTGALHGANDTWIGAGKLQVPSAAPPKKKHVATKPRMDDDEGPPKLKRPGNEKPAAAPAPSTGAPASGSSGTASSSAPAESKPQDSDRPVLIRPHSQDDSASSSGSESQPDSDRPVLKRPDEQKASSASSSQPPDDPNRPRLRRGIPPPTDDDSGEPDVLLPTPVKTTANKNAAPAATPAGNVRIIPAISDAGGPEPRSFAYEMKPDEEQTLRKKVLALAAKELWAKAAGTAASSTEPASKPAKRPARAAAAPQPNFEDVQLRVFDLTSSNEPVLVLSARATLPHAKTPPNGYLITLVARSDIYGDLHKVLSQITDDQHLDVVSRYELIDAVDADGDGRGDLLFRRVSDQGKSFAVYRVIGDQLWPLFEGTPQ
ncbi:MAG TPA: hypothetical protein VMH85_01215 [Terriglobales bacterium]|nr:hypothetical protein [Terriglobales bacterium]